MRPRPTWYVAVISSALVIVKLAIISRNSTSQGPVVMVGELDGLEVGFYLKKGDEDKIENRSMISIEGAMHLLTWVGLVVGPFCTKEGRVLVG